MTSISNYLMKKEKGYFDDGKLDDALVSFQQIFLLSIENVEGTRIQGHDNGRE